MGKGNIDNLRVPSSAEAREIGRKGGIASGAARRRKGSITDAIDACLKGKISDAEMVDKLRALGMPDLTYADAIAVKMADKAASGDVEAARFVRDTHGEKPADRHEVRADVSDLSSVSTADLLAMVADEVAEDDSD